MLEATLFTAAVVFCYMILFFAFASVLKNNAIVDLAWGSGFILVVGLNLLRAQEVTIRQVLVTGLVTLWGIRLVVHIYTRNRGKPEDFRYRRMRERWGDKAAIRSFTRVFLLQGALLLLVAYPLIMVHVYPEEGLTALDVLGMGVWTVGFLFESVSDYQLRRFIEKEKSPSNPIMIRGLWRYSRHPNYFGEAVVWWGIFLMVLSTPNGWMAVLSPILITFLLLRVSGVPLLERRYKDSRVYQAYASRTPVFVPWFPKKQT